MECAGMRESTSRNQANGSTPHRLQEAIKLLVFPRAALIAENPFLRKQLALFQERKAKSHRTTAATRLAMLALARCFDWREALVIVKPQTFIQWHRTAFRLFWRWKSRKLGRPSLPRNLRDLVREMARENPTWGEARIADELRLKLGIQISPRTVRKYLDSDRPRRSSGQRWSIFVRNHAKAIVACDFFISVTATFQVLYVFVPMEIGSRRILHTNATAHPTAEWTIQQFREFLAFDHPYRFVIHDRDGIFAPGVDQTLKGFGVRALKTPVRAPTANAFCERLVGTFRRECLDFLIPINERHLRRILKEFTLHYNRGRPHSALGPGIPEPPQDSIPASGHRHELPVGYPVISIPVLGGLHHTTFTSSAAIIRAPNSTTGSKRRRRFAEPKKKPRRKLTSLARCHLKRWLRLGNADIWRMQHGRRFLPTLFRWRLLARIGFWHPICDRPHHASKHPPAKSLTQMSSQTRVLMSRP
jgi:putative transposase